METRVQLNADLKSRLLNKATGLQREELEGLIERYHDKFMDGSITKAEVAAISFRIASCLDQKECEQASVWIKDLFMDA